MKLYTFAISHFSEKARWGLDRAGLDYREKVILPGFHMVRIPLLAPGTSVPVLVDDEGVATQGSSAILDRVGQLMGTQCLHTAAADVESGRVLEAELDVAFGSALQTILYSEALRSDRAFIKELWAVSGPAWGPAFLAVGFPMIAPVLARMYCTQRPDAVKQAYDGFCAGLDRFDGLLAQSPYLGGEGPNRADFTLAALLAPMVAPAEHPAAWKRLPQGVTKFIQPHLHRPVFAHVRLMYRKFRHGEAAYKLGAGGAHLAAA